MIELAGVTLAYAGRTGEVLALRDTELKVKRGEFAAVVGPSGCGKSTLMKLVTGLVPPTRGTVTVDGKPVAGPVKIAGMAFQNAESAALAHASSTTCCCRSRSSSRIASASRAQGAGSGPAPRSCSPLSGLRLRRAAIRGNCPAACSSAPRCAAP